MTQILTFAPLDVDAQREFLFAAHRETSALTFGTAFTDAQIERELERERGNCIGAFRKDECVGICDIDMRSRGDEYFGWVHFFYLLPELRGCGLGVQLIEHAVQFCREHGLKKLYLRVGAPNVVAYRFYARNAFERFPEFDRPGEYAFVMHIS